MDFEVRSPHDSEVDGLITFACEHFVEQEPMAKAVDVDANDLRPVIAAIVQQSVRENLVQIAVRDENMIGFGINVRLYPDQEEKPPLAPKVAAIFNLIQQLEAMFLARNTLPLDKVACSLMIGVKRDKSLGRVDMLRPSFALSQGGIEQLRSQGIQRTFVQTTSVASHRLAERVGMETWAEIRYRDYECPILHSKPFAALPGSCRLGVLDL